MKWTIRIATNVFGMCLFKLLVFKDKFPPEVTYPIMIAGVVVSILCVR